jgi:hypothetical protein
MGSQMSKNKKLTLETLKKMVLEEKKKLQKQGIISFDTKEDSWAGGENLVNKIDYVKKLGMVEARLRKKADNISRAKKALRKKIIDKI